MNIPQAIRASIVPQFASKIIETARQIRQWLRALGAPPSSPPTVPVAQGTKRRNDAPKTPRKPRQIRAPSLKKKNKNISPSSSQIRSCSDAERVAVAYLRAFHPHARGGARPDDVLVAQQALSLQFVQEQDDPVDYLLQAIEGCRAKYPDGDPHRLVFMLGARYIDGYAALGLRARCVAQAARQAAVDAAERPAEGTRGPGLAKAAPPPVEVAVRPLGADIAKALAKFERGRSEPWLRTR